MYSEAHQHWLIYRCLDPECGTLVYVGARTDRVPEGQRACMDCGGPAQLQAEPRERSRRDSGFL